MASDFAYYYALWKMNGLGADEVPAIACEALQAGLDSPALRVLAGMVQPTRGEVTRVFDDASPQLGIPAASDAEVEQRKEQLWMRDAIESAKRTCAQIVNGEIDPALGWLGLPYRASYPDCLKDKGPLSVFFGFARPDEDVRFDDAFRRRVVETAKHFLATIG